MDSSKETDRRFRYIDGNLLFFSWGPAFKGVGKSPQIMAWKYSPAEQKIKFFYAKDDHYDRDKTNKIGAGMISSACNYFTGYDSCPDLELVDKSKKYSNIPNPDKGIENKVKLPGIGTLTLRLVDNRMRLVKPDDLQCVLRYTYSCSRTQKVNVFKDEKGNDC